MLALGPLGIGPFELILILAVVVIIFGVGRLPEVGGAVGKGIREFRKSARDEDKDAGQIEQPKASAETASGPHCTNCGRQNEPEAKFCANCGSELGAKVN